MIISVVYLLARCLPGCLMVLARREVSKDAERWCCGMKRGAAPADRLGPLPAGDRLWLAALSRLIPRHLWAEDRRAGQLGGAGHGLAYAIHSTGELNEAIRLFERVLADHERAFGSDHPDTLTSRNNLAYAYESAGRLAEAIRV